MTRDAASGDRSGSGLATTLQQTGLVSGALSTAETAVRRRPAGVEARWQLVSTFALGGERYE